MNYERAKIIALLSGTPLVRCTSGGQIVYCRLLSADEIKALKDRQQVYMTNFTGRNDWRLMSGYCTREGVVDGFSPYFVFRCSTGVSTRTHYIMRTPVEPLENDEDD